MKIHRIYGIVLRFLYYFRRSLDRMSDVFYWPSIDLLLWGLTSTYYRTLLPQSSPVVLMIVSGILLWIILWRGQYEITVNMLDDLWNKNLINVFASPLKLSEWLAAFLIIGLIKAIISILFASGVAFLLFKTHIFGMGFYLIPISLTLIMSGWWIGLFIAGIILRYGSRVQTFAWTLVMVFSPFSAIYYPLSILPDWAQVIAKFIPMSYVFEASRKLIEQNVFDTNAILISFALNFGYLILAVWYIKRSFAAILNKGLVKVY